MFPRSLEGYILRYKTLYSTAGLILGIIAMIGGYWLASLKYEPQVTGWMLNTFGCNILENSNNFAPGFFLFWVGLFVIIMTQYRIKTNRRPKVQSNIDEKALLYRFIFSMVGLTGGFLSMILGILLTENGGNLCAADWTTMITSDYKKLGDAGIVLFLVGIIILIATRYRIRIYNNLGSEIP